MERGIYPTYYLHMEKEDGKKVRKKLFFFENQTKSFYCESDMVG